MNLKSSFLRSYSQLIKKRPKNSHKGTFGTVAIIGNANLLGASILAGSAALKSGCGKVIIGLDQNILLNKVCETLPELIFQKITSLTKNLKINAWVVGCGLGRTYTAFSFMKKILKDVHSGKKIVIDADGLNIFSTFSPIPVLKENCVITPHPKEASKLLRCSIEEIQFNRIKKARSLSQKMNCWVVLKGYHTIISSPIGEISINKTGNISLSTSGTGDVLSGIIGSLFAQKIPTEIAIKTAVWLHGKAADNLTTKKVGPIGLIAHELVNEVRMIINELRNNI